MEWRRQLIEAIQAGNTALAHQHAMTAINDPANKFFCGTLQSKKKYHTPLMAKGNMEYFLANKEMKEKRVLADGDVIAVKFGNLYLVGLVSVSDMKIGLRTPLMAGEPDYIRLMNYGFGHSVLLIPAQEYMGQQG